MRNKNMDKTALWEAVLQRLSAKISRMEFLTWFKKVHISNISGEAIELACPTEMNKNWLETKYQGILLANIQAILPEISRIYLTVNLSLADSPEKNPAAFEEPKAPRKLPNQPVAKTREGIETRITNSKFTLENFIAGETNRFVHAACNTVAQQGPKDEKKYNPLFIYGGVGLGKTHLLQAIANEMIRRNPEIKIIYTTAERLLPEMVDAMKKQTVASLRSKYRKVDVFLLDDVQFFEDKEKTQIELFNMFNDLHDLNKQIVFSADRPPSMLIGLSDRLRSRLGWGLQAEVKMPAIETRKSIIIAKSTAMQLFLPEEVQEYIAKNLKNNLREVENILKQVAAQIEIENISPTIHSVGKILRNLYPEETLLTGSIDKKSKLAKNGNDIISLISDYFQITAVELTGSSRKQEIVLARQFAWLLCKDVLKMSYEAIGAIFNGKNHTTIMHGIKKIRGLIRTDSNSARHLHILRKDLGMKD